MQKLEDLLYEKATNRSKAKTTGEPVANTPRMDKVKTELSEVDIAINLQYNTVALKAFYLMSKKSYKLDINPKDAQLVIDILMKRIQTPESIFEAKNEAGWGVER